MGLAAHRWPPRSRLRTLALAGALLVALAVPASGDRQSERRFTESGPEPILAKILSEVRAQRLDSALTLTDELIEQYPTFQLGHLVKGDLLLARARPLSSLGNPDNASTKRLDELRAEAVARINAYGRKPSADKLPAHLVEMRPDQRHAVLVHTSKSRLYVYANDRGRPRMVADFYVSQGRAGSAKEKEGDLKTPLGVYHVTSHLPPAKLTEFYGSGAFPINYPNDWDRRSGRTGYGIWLHGTPPGSFSRAPRASEGCVVLANQDLEALGAYLQVGLTPVIIAEGIDWIERSDWDTQRAELRAAIESWRSAWESRDTERYLRHYAARFETPGQSRASFSASKRAVNAGKTWIKVAVDNLSIFGNPSPDNFFVVTFDQAYASNNLTNQMRKQQYWIREAGEWRILYEGNA